jgi:imidazolonepropionase-like amidohydrolase
MRINVRKTLFSVSSKSSSIAVVALVCAASAVVAQPARPAVIFENVRIFDGQSDALSAPSNVLVTDGRIASISTDEVTEDGAIVIDGEGKVLMPGLIDAHWHTMLIGVTPDTGLHDMGYTHLIAGVEATATLMRGFTTVRDLGGPSFGLKKIIDQGLIPGPRIYPSGAILTVTSGHGDFRSFADLPRKIGELTPMEEAGMSMVTDSPDEVRLRAREQLMQGASQIKLTAGGGVASPFSPLDASTFIDDEIRAAVQAAENWGTYVGVHAYTPQAVQTAINSGVKVIEHAHLIDDETAQLMAEKEIWLSTQAFDESMGSGLPPASVEKFHQVLEGTSNIYEFARKYDLKTAWGTDILFSSAIARGQNAMILNLLKWYTPVEALQMITGTNGELLLLSGKRNPYPGRIGLIDEGNYADLLLVNGNPLDDLSLLADPERNFLVIMKDGVIHKDITDGQP